MFRSIHVTGRFEIIQCTFNLMSPRSWSSTIKFFFLHMLTKHILTILNKYTALSVLKMFCCLIATDGHSYLDELVESI